MGKGAIIIGIGAILFGIFLLTITHIVSWIYGIIIISIGIGLIVYYNAENEIEKRKDLKPKKE